jgi:hypothetical protein
MGNAKSTAIGYPDGPFEINLSNFKLLRVVGKGSYGKVSSSPLRGARYLIFVTKSFFICQAYRGLITLAICAGPLDCDDANEVFRSEW